MSKIHLVDLQEYDITIVYKSGRKHSDADSLSRNPLISTSVETCDEIPTLESVTEYIKEQLKDPKLKSIIKVLKRGDEYQNYLLKDGVLYKKTFDPMGQQWLLVVPKQLRGDIFEAFMMRQLPVTSDLPRPTIVLDASSTGPGYTEAPEDTYRIAKKAKDERLHLNFLQDDFNQ
ncbi:hypothetical protein AVEN_125731-1 [Araneus ventricosus]|uniref:Uncharacterized protein n=1 Tax=Araneus ventricosus TaxID=182803 RepID=A0A4Y2LC75_ARAVE|nr:hypothetical protein AVEN_125731-1 [Araneus ventricosus]